MSSFAYYLTMNTEKEDEYSQKWLRLISVMDETTLSARDKSCAPELGLEKPMHVIPASFAALIPCCESSITRQASGLTANSSAAFRKISGSGLLLLTSSPLTITEK